MSHLTLLPNRSLKPGVAPSKIQSGLFVKFPEIANGPPVAGYRESPATARSIPGKPFQAGDQPGYEIVGLGWGAEDEAVPCRSEPAFPAQLVAVGS